MEKFPFTNAEKLKVFELVLDKAFEPGTVSKTSSTKYAENMDAVREETLKTIAELEK